LSFLIFTPVNNENKILLKETRMTPPSVVVAMIFQIDFNE